MNSPQKTNTLALDPQALYFIPLGGSEQFGVNLNVYASGGKFLAVDCGLGFADERYPGIDLLLPDPLFLEDRAKDLAGLVITHAHEDHIGAVAYLWEGLKCPVYTTRFTAVVLREKFKEKNIRGVKIHVIDPLDSVDIGPFNVKFLPVSHSVPDTTALLIETKQGRVLHSGDWNLDPNPILGEKTNAAPFRAAGDLGIVAYIGDSTNAQVPGSSGSESVIEDGLYEEFKKCDGKIAVTLFSSNIGRVISIMRAAKRAGRKVGVVGRSLHKMIAAAVDCDYLEGVTDFVNEDEIPYAESNKLVLIVTGSQGEFRSALAKISRGVFQNVKLGRGDTVIFSARGIPGNEKAINAVKNNLTAAGIKVISPDDTANPIHVSGHPCRDEIKQMLEWVRPQVVIPVHGERVQLQAHADLARENGIGQVIIPTNGAVIRLAPGQPETVDHVPTGLLAVDQKRVVSADHSSIAERRKLQFTGAVHVSVAIDAKGELRSDPAINTVGLLDPENPREARMQEALYDDILDAVEDLSAKDMQKEDLVEEEIRRAVRRFFSETVGIKPMVNVHVLRV